jgi:hypothetical protein
MTQISDKPADDECGILNLDFDKLVALISEGADKLGPAPGNLRTVEHAVTHLREETGLSDKQIARVMLTANYVLTGIVREIGPKWTSVACANWLGLCGQRLWEAEDRPTLRTRLAHGLGIGRRADDEHQDDDVEDATAQDGGADG